MTTIVIDDPAIESAIARVAANAGVTVQKAAYDILAEHLVPAGTPKESAQAFFDRIGHPGPTIDASREGIYVDH